MEWSIQIYPLSKFPEKFQVFLRPEKYVDSDLGYTSLRAYFLYYFLVRFQPFCFLQTLARVPGAAQHVFVVRCRPGIVTHSNLLRPRICAASLRGSLVLRRVRGRYQFASIPAAFTASAMASTSLRKKAAVAAGSRLSGR